MILEGLLELIYGLLSFVFGSFSIPDFPSEVQNVIDEVSTAITNVIGIVGIFIDWNMVFILIPVVIATINFDIVWKVVMFILRKIPFLGIE